MKQICFDLPTFEQVEFEIVLHEENIPIRGNAIASGDNDYDKEVEDSIFKDLENGNQWAWCCVEMVCKYKGLKGNDYLGACSYKNEDDFREGGYYEDMQQTAYNNLIQELEQLTD